MEKEDNFGIADYLEIVLGCNFAAKWIGHTAVLIENGQNRRRFSYIFSLSTTFLRTEIVMKKIKIIFLVLLALIGIQIFRMTIQVKWFRENAANTLNEYNMNEYSNNNEILLCSPAEMLDFPFIFGEKLYFYDLEKQNKYLVDKTIKPLSGYGNSLGLGDKQIYYNEEFFGEGVVIYQKKIGSLIRRKQVLDYAGIYSFDSENIYYMKDEEIEEGRNGLYKKNLKSGQKKTLFEGELSNVLRLDHSKIYMWDSGRKEVLEISKDGKEIARCGGIDGPLWIGYKDKNEIIIIEPDKIVCYDKQKRKKKTVIGGIKKEGKYFEYTAKYDEKTKDLYCNNYEMEFFRINMETGKKECFLSLKKDRSLNIPEEYYADVYYCKDYIAVDIIKYDTKAGIEICKRNLLIYDYKGKQIAKENLKGRLF